MKSFNIAVIYTSVVIFIISVIFLAVIDFGKLDVDTDFVAILYAALLFSVFVGLASFAVALRTGALNDNEESE
jgi:hypothetical protein